MIMSSNPASPTTSIRRPRSIRLSSFEVSEDSSQSPYTSGTTNGTNYSRRSSRTSQTSFLQSPTTPRPMSARSSRPSSIYHRRKSSSRLSIGSNNSMGINDNGLGNLADELEDALEDEHESNDVGFLDTYAGDDLETAHISRNRGNYSGNESIVSPQSPTSPRQSLQTSIVQSPNRLRTDKRKSRHQRVESKYDGSDYGPESDPEDGFTPALAKRMGDIEALARMGVNSEDTLSEGGGVVKRTIHALKDLGPQAGIEASITRIITAYTSMATHRTHKTREVFSQTHSILYGNIFGLPEEVVDSLLAEIEILSSTVAFTQQQSPLLALQMLASQTLDLAQNLRSLTDTLHESRIQVNAATRKLKNVKDMVEEVCTEQELLQTSIMLIHAGDWDRRCRERQAAATCREVVRGFSDRWGLELDDKPWTREREIVS